MKPPSLWLSANESGKQLGYSCTATPQQQYDDSDALSQAKEHTVFIVRADALLEFLKSFEVRSEAAQPFE